MFFTTAQGNEWGPDLFLHVVRQYQASWSIGCWPVQQGETEAAYLPPQVVPLGFVLGEMMSALGQTVSIQTRSGSPNVLLADLTRERQFCSWSLLHDVDLLKTAVHLVSAVEHSGLHPQMFSSPASVSSSEASWVDWAKERDLFGRRPPHDEEFRGIVGGRRRGERQPKALWRTIFFALDAKTSC